MYGMNCISYRVNELGDNENRMKESDFASTEFTLLTHITVIAVSNDR